MDENFEIDKPNLDKYYYQVRVPIAILRIGQYVVLGVGLVLLIFSLSVSYYIWHESEISNLTAEKSRRDWTANENTPLLYGN